MRRSLALGLLLLTTADAAWAAEECLPDAVHLLRHAEKAVNDADPDVVLSEAGQRRAQALPAWFVARSVDAIYATHLRRTQQTAAPLAATRNLDIRVLPAGDTDRLVHRLRQQHCGEHVVVVGHSNTVPEIARGLGADTFEIADTEFGIVYTLAPPLPQVSRQTFGEPADEAH